MIYKKWKQVLHSFQFKLMLCYFFFSMLPLLFIGFISYSISYKIAESKITESTKLAHNQLCDSINNRFTQMEKVADSVYSNLYVLNNQMERSFSDYIDTFGAARHTMTSLTNTFQLFQTCAFVSDESIISQEGLMFYGLNELSRYKIEEADLSNIGIKSKWLFRKSLIFPIIATPKDRSTDIILCCRSLNEKGVLKFAYFVSIKSDEIVKLLTIPFENTPIKCFLLDSTGAVAACNQTNKDLPLNNDGKMYSSVLVNGYSLNTYIPDSYMKENIKVLLRWIILSLFLFLPFMILLTIFVMNTMTKKLRILTTVIESTNLDNTAFTTMKLENCFRTSVDSSDELDKLAQTFCATLKKLEENVAKIIVLNVHEERLKYQVLQSQINPHFLYNILGSIQTSQRMGNLIVAEQMLSKLSKFYRLLLRKSGDLICISDELDITCLYLEMEHLCREGSFTWQIMKDDGIENFQICKFTLQPFLENCILHGFKPGGQTLHLQILVTYKEDNILITISDDGCGISSQKLSKLRNSLQNHFVDTETHFGICNVNARISSPLFGSGSVHIESKPNAGTIVTIEFAQLLDC